MTETPVSSSSHSDARNALTIIQGPLDRHALDVLRSRIFADRSEYEQLRSWLHQQSEEEQRVGIGYWALGAWKDAEQLLEDHAGQPMVDALRAYALLSRGRFAEARNVIGTPKDAEEASVFALTFVRERDVPAVEKIVADLGHVAGTATEHFLRGWLAEQSLDVDDAIDHYERAYELDPFLADNCFHFARLLELRGDDEAALDIYEQTIERLPPNPSMLANLGLLYEDLEEFAQSEACYRTILKADPTNARARLFLEDVLASKNMQYDEDQERREDKRNAILRTPVTDFELSVRSRNCLAKMGIRTLGDLVQKTEAELLSYKNFGETSLMEIQQILHAKNLRLGMDADELDETALQGPRTPLGDQSDPRNRPIAELELSVRSRRVVDMFKLRTIGDLCQKTEAELMACPNFGQTSLNEIKSKLDELGLGLKG
ncbi:MAG: tetratricopeptide repeat protein [Planctomycetes bacterium]|nr:tetratricopeptide repeat protein [Planctomycetota bacterium]